MSQQIAPNIRQGNADDVQKIADFNVQMAWETEAKKLDKEQVFQGVNLLIQQPQYGFYLVAELENTLIGCLMITYEWSDWRNGLFWWIQSVYVLPEYRRHGIYRQLYQIIQQMAKDQNTCGFRLYVEKDNIIAQQTYQSLGMDECDYFMYEAAKS